MRRSFLVFSVLSSAIGASSSGPPIDLTKVAREISEEQLRMEVLVLTGEISTLTRDNQYVGRVRDRFSPAFLAYARQYLAQALGGLGPVTWDSYKLQNSHEIFANIPAERVLVNLSVEIIGSTKPEEIITIGAHYDTTGKLRPGANDNASGVAGVLAMAAALKLSNFQPERTIRLILFDGEEIGFRGSEAHFSKSDRMKVSNKLYINLDMIGCPTGNLWKVSFDAAHSEDVADLLRQANNGQDRPFILDSWRDYRSDNQSAVRYNVPAMALFDHLRDENGQPLGKDPNNHSRDDVAIRLNYEYATAVTRLALTTALLASQQHVTITTHRPPSFENQCRRWVEDLLG